LKPTYRGERSEDLLRAAGSQARSRVPFENMRTQFSHTAFLSVRAPNLLGGWR